MKKTNAARILDNLGVSYETREYRVDADHLSAAEVARAIGLPAGQVFKTLVARGDRTGVLLACLPGSAELSLTPNASVAGRTSTLRSRRAARWVSPSAPTTSAYSNGSAWALKV